MKLVDRNISKKDISKALDKKQREREKKKYAPLDFQLNINVNEPNEEKKKKKITCINHKTVLNRLHCGDETGGRWRRQRRRKNILKKFMNGSKWQQAADNRQMLVVILRQISNIYIPNSSAHSNHLQPFNWLFVCETFRVALGVSVCVYVCVSEKVTDKCT